MSQSLLKFDTDHIKSYVFGTNRLKEIRGASSILDKLNRTETVKRASKYGARTVYAHGGSALFVVESADSDANEQAELFGQEVQKLYHKSTGGGASITYAIQSIPPYDTTKDIMQVEQLDGISMQEVLKLLQLRLRMAKDSLGIDVLPGERTQLALPTHALLCPCESCGVAYAQDTWKDPDDLEEEEGRYCRVCLGKRTEDRIIKNLLRASLQEVEASDTLWERIIEALGKDYLPPRSRLPQRPKDFNVFRDFTHGKEYLGLIYADANNMGRAMGELETLEKVQIFARRIDKAVFNAMGFAIKTHLPLQGDTFPFDILLVGGDDIVLVVPADKALQVAHTLADQFHQLAGNHTLSVGVVLAPIKYPFGLQQELAEETLKAAKKSAAQQQSHNKSDESQEQTLINIIVVTGNTSLNYKKQYEEMHRKSTSSSPHEFYATLRPYTLTDFAWLLEQIKQGNEKHLGRTKLNQLREAIMKLNQTTAILEALALLRNWKLDERKFIKDLVQNFDVRQTVRQQQLGSILFPWSLDGKASSDTLTVYRTPLLDFIELYDFVS